jgi:hypothetical protein
MIRDLSETLREILADPGLSGPFPELSAAQIAFDRPVEAFSPGRTTVDLFLFDVRENMELRSNEPQHVRVGGDVSIRQPPLRVACSYLVTAWPTSGTDLPLQEHRLLGQALQVLSRHPKILVPFLKGKLVGQEPPLPMITARADGLKDPHEFWAAIGNKMRASIVVTATIGMDVFPTITAPGVIAAKTRLGVRSSPDAEGLIPATTQEFFRIGGRVTLTAGGAPVPDAKVELAEPGLTARTDGEGRFQLGSMSAGTYTLRVTKDATVKTASVVVPPASDDEYDVQI